MAIADVKDTFRRADDIPNLSQVKLDHAKLMRAYVGAISTASLVGRTSGSSSEPIKDPTKDSFASGLLLRWLVGSHIRRRLVDLATIYLQLEQVLYHADTGTVDPWLSKTRENCLAIVDRLPRLRLPGFIALGSLALSVATALSKLPGWIGYLFLSLAGLGLVFVCLGYLTIRDSYLAKRSLFLPDAKRVDKQDPDKQKRVIDSNIYAIEDQLFRILHRGRKPETQVDVLLFNLANLLVLEGILFLIFWLAPTIAWLGVLIPSIIIGIEFLVRRRWRKNRAWL